MIRSTARTILIGIFGSGALVGCAHRSDLTMRNPLAAHAVDSNRIVKEDATTERTRGLPASSMANQAVLVAADPRQLCFDVTLHELEPLDLARAKMSLSAPDAETSKQAKLDAEAPSEKTYDGLVAVRRITGSETTCAGRSSDGCRTWETHPTYSESYVPGPVRVFEARGRVCFDNRVANETTEQLSLELRFPRKGPPTTLFGGGGGGKKVVFRWGFQKGGPASGAVAKEPAAKLPSPS